MWTLLNSTAMVATGIFRTRGDAESFARTFLPTLQMLPIELLVNDSHAGALDDQQLYTWPPPGSQLTIDTPVMGKPC